MANIISFLIWQAILYSYGLFNFFLYLGLAVRSGTFFSKPTEQEQNEFLLGETKSSHHSQLQGQLTEQQLETNTGIFPGPSSIFITASWSSEMVSNFITSPTSQP